MQAQSIYGGIHFSGPEPPVPAQLPALGLFTGREAELASLRRLAAGTSLVVIRGTGGVGKTSLAVRWLREISDDFPGGRLFVDLRGFTGTGPPTPAGEPLERFLRALGTHAERVPPGLDEQVALYRSMTADRRLIVLLDNAATAAQVRPLLPGGPALVVVTTRHRLTGLATDGARFFDLNPLDRRGALELLEGILGSERVVAQQSEAASLVDLCGRLPLAVCASAARLAARSTWPIDRVVRELADETDRLAALSREQDVSVRAVFDLSYGDLSDGAADLYRSLGAHPGADFDAAASAAAAGRASATGLLDELTGASLLGETPDGRFRFHDLLRLHARGLLTEAGRATAFGRLAAWYLATAAVADRTVNPGRWRLGPAAEGDLFADGPAALDWLDGELDNLIMVQRQAHQDGLNEVAWRLCDALWGLFVQRGHYRRSIGVHRIGVAAATACGDRPAQARMLEALGYAHLTMGEYAAAIDNCERALRLARDAGHRLAEASALEYLGSAELARGDGERAVGRFARARDIHQDLGRPRGVALMVRHTGRALAAAGHHEEAVHHFTEALRFFAEHGERYHEARTLTMLSGSLPPDDADHALEQVLTITREIGAHREEAAAHHALADLAARRNAPTDERAHLQKALAIYAALGAPEADDINRRLA